MRLKTKITIAAVSAAAITVAGVVVVVRVHRRRHRRKEASSFLSADVRDALQGLCSLQGEDFVPDGLGSSLYQRRLESLTDKQLIGVYVVIKVAEALRARGVDVRQISKEDLLNEVGLLHNVTHNKSDRRELLRRLGLLGAETAKGVLDDGLLLTGIAAQSS
ncbi:MAG: hypothetical protein Q4A07_01675 [Coriobacteriales bacterium]|nr:hypothetical protein [Coriobacteriales bacterium]